MWYSIFICTVPTLISFSLGMAIYNQSKNEEQLETMYCHCHKSTSSILSTGWCLYLDLSMKQLQVVLLPTWDRWVSQKLRPRKLWPQTTDPENSDPRKIFKKRLKFVSMFKGNSHTSRQDVKLLWLIAVTSIKQWKSNIHHAWFIAVALVIQWIPRFQTAADTVLQKRPSLCNRVQQKMCCFLKHIRLKQRFHRNLLFDLTYNAWLN